MNAMKYVSIAALLLVALQGCTTTKSPKKIPKLNTRVLQHPGYDKNLISKVSRAQWIGVRKKKTQAHVKLYSSLGARAFGVAIQDARAYLTKKPKDLHALIVLATSLAMTGKYQLAGYYAGIIEKQHSGLAITKNLQGLSLLHRPGMKIRDYRVAADHFNQAMERDPSEVAAALNLGHLYLKMGHAKAAARTFRSAKVRCQLCGVAVIGEAIAAARLGKFEKSKDLLLQTIKKEPQNMEAHFRIAGLYLHKYKDKSNAAWHLNQILESKKGGLDYKRQANVLLRRMDATEFVSTLDEE